MRSDTVKVAAGHQVCPGTQCLNAGPEVGHLGAGWNVDETSKKRGLLEDFRLQCEVGLTVAFERMRWLLHKALWLPSPSAERGSAGHDADEAAAV